MSHLNILDKLWIINFSLTLINFNDTRKTLVLDVLMKDNQFEDIVRNYFTVFLFMEIFMTYGLIIDL